MRRVHALTGSLVLVALFASSQLAGQTVEGPNVTWSVKCHACRPGTEIKSAQLGEFLAKNITVEVSKETEPGLGGLLGNLLMRAELNSREEGIIGNFESKAVEIKGGKTYPGSVWIPASNVARFSAQLAPGFGDRRKIGFLGFGVWDEHGGCYLQKATHTVRITLVSDDEQFVKNGQPMVICLGVGDEGGA